jgi:hypothetical protein
MLDFDTISTTTRRDKKESDSWAHFEYSYRHDRSSKQPSSGEDDFFNNLLF